MRQSIQKLIFKSVERGDLIPIKIMTELLSPFSSNDDISLRVHQLLNLVASDGLFSKHYEPDEFIKRLGMRISAKRHLIKKIKKTKGKTVNLLDYFEYRVEDIVCALSQEQIQAVGGDKIIDFNKMDAIIFVKFLESLGIWQNIDIQILKKSLKEDLNQMRLIKDLKKVLCIQTKEYLKSI